MGREGFEPPTPCASCNLEVVRLLRKDAPGVMPSRACHLVWAAHKCSAILGLSLSVVVCHVVLSRLHKRPERALATFVATSAPDERATGHAGIDLA